jgi:hypothetical protein
MTRDQVKAWLRDDDHHTLAQLFARRGMSVPRAAASLAPAGELRDHAVDVLAQGHLAHHALFHYFHQPLIASPAEPIFEVGPPGTATAFLAVQQHGLKHWLGSQIEKPGAGRAGSQKGSSHAALLCFLLRGYTGCGREQVFVFSIRTS